MGKSQNLQPIKAFDWRHQCIFSIALHVVSVMFLLVILHIRAHADECIRSDVDEEEFSCSMDVSASTAVEGKSMNT